MKVHPHSELNGVAERFNKTIQRTIRIKQTNKIVLLPEVKLRKFTMSAMLDLQKFQKTIISLKMNWDMLY